MQTDRRAAISAAILVIIRRKISTVDFRKECDESSLYIKFGRKWGKYKLECTQVHSDMWRPFWQPSWLSDKANSQTWESV